MPILVPNSWGSLRLNEADAKRRRPKTLTLDDRDARPVYGQEDLREYNKCHNPPGHPEGGGRFCSGGGGRGQLSSLLKSDDGFYKGHEEVIGKVHDKLMTESFSKGEVRETLAMWSPGSKDYEDFLVGDEDSVVFTEEIIDRWAQPGRSRVMFHTHPASSAFSFADLEVVNRINRMRQSTHEPLPIPRSVVFGKDGSWFELTFKEAIRDNHAQMLKVEYERAREEVAERAAQKTDEWLRSQGFHVTPEIRGFVAEQLFKLKGIDVQERHDKHYAEESHKIWMGVNLKAYGIRYRDSKGNRNP